jgi:hypothetical protein
MTQLVERNLVSEQALEELELVEQDLVIPDTEKATDRDLLSFPPALGVRCASTLIEGKDYTVIGSKFRDDTKRRCRGILEYLLF